MSEEDNEGSINDNSNDNEYSDNESVTNLNGDDDDKNVNNEEFKLFTYENVLENIQNTIKKTIPILTKFERARIMGVRMQQLAYGAKPRVDTTDLKSIAEIVNKELLERKIPFIIRRTLPNGKFENWKLEEFLIV
jgi:DNA-directed RNA polymerase I, II, and III subunit RPABC2